MKFLPKVALLLAVVGSAVEAHDVRVEHGVKEKRNEHHAAKEERNKRNHHGQEDKHYDHPVDQRIQHHGVKQERTEHYHYGRGGEKERNNNNLRTTRHHHPEARCTDVSGWKDSGDYLCSDFNVQMCKDYGSDKGTNNLSANEACCVCKNAPTPAPVSAPTIAPGSAGSKATEWLSAHNTRRQKYAQQWGYEYTAVGWNEDLAAQAQAWANYLLAKQCIQTPHASNQCLANTGENIASSWDSGTATTNIDSVLEEWTEKEIALTDPYQAGHASQVLWKESVAIGCADAVGSCNYGDMKTAAIQVCRYYPAGNLNCGQPNDACIDFVKQKKTSADTTQAMPTTSNMHQCLAGSGVGYP